MESVMEAVVDDIVQNALKTDHFMVPTLNEMYGVSDAFYRRVVTAAYQSAKDEKAIETKHVKRLARGPMGIPRRFRDLEKLFRDRRYWPKILKRSRAMTDRLRKAYIEKLRRKFDVLIPQLKAGELSQKKPRNP